MTIISDKTAIAKTLATYSSGSYGSSTTTTGSYWNPHRLPMNCVLVCLGFILDRTSNQLSYKAAIPQPPNGYADWDEVENVLRWLRQIRLVKAWLKAEKPFDYERYIGPGDDLVFYRRPLLPEQTEPDPHCVLAAHYNGDYKFYDFQHTKGGTKEPKAHDISKEFKFESGQRKGAWDFSRIDFTVKVVPYLHGSSRDANVL
jgi:hypothetical protein